MTAKANGAEDGILSFSIAVGIVILVFVKPVTGHLKIKSERNPLQHYDTVGYVVAGTGVVAIFLIHLLDRQIHRKLHKKMDVPL